MHCIVVEKEKSHLEFLCKKICLSKKKEDRDSGECASFLVFIAFLKSQGEGTSFKGAKRAGKKRGMKTSAKYQTNPYNKPKLINKNIKIQTCTLWFSISFRTLPPTALEQRLSMYNVYWLRCKINICICVYGTFCCLFVWCLFNAGLFNRCCSIHLIGCFWSTR